MRVQLLTNDDFREKLFAGAAANLRIVNENIENGVTTATVISTIKYFGLKNTQRPASKHVVE